MSHLGWWLALFPALLRAEPVRLLIDTDIGPDCDDAGALAVAHALEQRGEARLLGIGYCTSNPYGAPCVDAINIYYGRPDIPVGTYKGAGFLENSTIFNRYIAEHWPNSLKHGTNAPDAASLYRQLLAQQPDQSVVVASIGQMTNLAQLLVSPPDQFSPLSGLELVAKKVTLLSCMGGSYPTGREFNFFMDAEGAKVVVDTWPSTVVFSGLEIGLQLLTGKRLWEQVREDNPIRKSYELYVGPDSNRYSWDQTAVLVAVRGLQDYWTAVEGTNSLNVTAGTNTFVAGEGKQRYLVAKMDPTEVAQQIEDLMIAARPGSSELAV